MDARSKTWVCGLSLAGFASSNAAGEHGWLLFECFVLSGRVLCYRPIPCPEKSYLVCVYVCVCDQVQKTLCAYSEQVEEVELRINCDSKQRVLH